MSPADVLGGLLRINLAAGAAVLAVVALRKPIRSLFGARVAYGLWLLPVLTGAAVLLPARQVLIVRTTAPALAALSGAAAFPSPSLAATSLDPLVIVGLWLVGVAGAALVMAGLQHRFMRKARGGGVGPAVVGVIAPRILTPRDFAARFNAGEQALVLAHERAHIARQDSRLNGLCAAAQCLFWFNPLIHLAARLMRVDQELACDEAVVARLPGARRAYAEVLVKAQLARLPLPLGCYWPPSTAHPLVERVAMLRRKGADPARRSAGAVVLTLLGAGAGLAAWASRPADVRVVEPTPAETAAAHGLIAHTPRATPLAPRPMKAASGRGASDPASRAITAAPGSETPGVERKVDDADAASGPSAQGMTPIQVKQAPLILAAQDAGSPQPAPPQSHRPDDGAAGVVQPSAPQPAPAAKPAVAAAPALIKASQAASAADDPDKIICRIQPVTGSRFLRRVCITRWEWREQQARMLVFERRWLLDPSGYSAADD